MLLGTLHSLSPLTPQSNISGLSDWVDPEMNREIASAPEKSEASFCARRTAAVARPPQEPCADFPDWSLKRAHGAGWGKREETTRRLGARALNLCIYSSGPTRRALAGSVYFSRNNPTTAERPDNLTPRTILLYMQINGILNSKLSNSNSKSQPKPEGGKININDVSVKY